MVKLKAPLIGHHASGTLAKILTYSESQGRAYAKRRSTPTDPRTQDQVAMRAIHKFLTTAWAKMTPTEQASWSGLATTNNTTLQAAFYTHNLERWRNDQPPTREYPATATAATRTWNAPTTQTLGRRIRLTWNLTALANFWAVIIYRIATPGTNGEWNELENLTYQVAPGEKYWDDMHPVVGTNRYALGGISPTGWEIPTPWHPVHTFP